MKALIVLVLLSVSSLAFASAGKLHFSGRVAEKVEVRSENGKLVITQNTPTLKIVVDNRAPASFVRVEAP